MPNNGDLNILINKVSDFISREIMIRSENGTLSDYLTNIGFHGGSQKLRNNKKIQKILIVGEIQMKENVIIGIFKELGISKNRIELISDYEKISKHDFAKYQYNEKYAAVLAGPVPHSGINISKYSSIISRLENDDGFPPTSRLYANSKLKVTNTNLKNALNDFIEKAVIIQDL